MIYAPVIIPTLNRYEHFIKLIASLQLNSYAKYTELYIGLDYPPNEKYREGYEKIKKYIDSGIQGFKKINLIEHEQNMGAGGNISYLHNIVQKKYDRFISSEDDNIVSPSFLEYMNKGLELIEHDDEMCFVCGYSYPVKWSSQSKNLIKEQSFVSAWGFGTFYKKREVIYNTIERDYSQNAYINRISDLRKKSKKNYVYFMNMAYRKHFSLNDIGYSCYQILENKYCLMPIISLVRNEGWDGSGLNCRDSSLDCFSNQEISTDTEFIIANSIKTSKDIKHLSYNEQLINTFFNVSCKDYIKALVKEVIVRVRAGKVYK